MDRSNEAPQRRDWSSLGRHVRGVASVEFAIVAIPFLTLLFLIIGAGIQLFAYGAMDAGMRSAARQIRIGAFRGTSDSAVRSLICSQMSGLASSCSALQIYVTSGVSFAALQAASVSNGTLSQTGFAPGVGGSFVLIQVAYNAPTLLPLPNAMATGFLSSTAFRNEP